MLVAEGRRKENVIAHSSYTQPQAIPGGSCCHGPCLLPLALPGLPHSPLCHGFPHWKEPLLSRRDSLPHLGWLGITTGSWPFPLLVTAKCNPVLVRPRTKEQPHSPTQAGDQPAGKQPVGNQLSRKELCALRILVDKWTMGLWQRRPAMFWAVLAK